MCIGHIANNRNALHHDPRENQNFNLHDKLQENGGWGILLIIIHPC